MTSNPFYNAVFALAYIFLVVIGISNLERFNVVEDNILMPISMLSLFVLSAAIMAYIFLYHPAIMLLDGKRKEAVTLFLHTAAFFAGITLIIFVASIVLFR